MSDEPQPRQPNQGGGGPTEPPAAAVAEEKQTPPQPVAEAKEPEEAREPKEPKPSTAGEKKVAPPRAAAEDTQTRQLTAVTVPKARSGAPAGEKRDPQDRRDQQGTQDTQDAQERQDTQDRQDTQTRQLAAIRAPKTPAPAAAVTASAAEPSPVGPPAAGVETKGGEKKMKRPKRTGWRRIIPTWRMVLGTFVLGVLLLIGLFFLGYSMVKIPAANTFATKQSNVYLYADGSQLARDGEVNRENVTLAQVSKDAQHAVLAAEDREFYTESAVDPKAMLRAGWNTATGKGTQSGSTITQQYVKNYYLAQEQTVTLNADDPLLFGPGLLQEYETARTVLALTDAQ
ncbi:transglycosylase domain-containing protein, partial [Streptomyces sp. NPDC005921]